MRARTIGSSSTTRMRGAMGVLHGSRSLVRISPIITRVGAARECEARPTFNHIQSSKRGGSDCTRYMHFVANAQYSGRFGNTVVILLHQLHELLDIVLRSPYFRITGTCPSF